MKKGLVIGTIFFTVYLVFVISAIPANFVLHFISLPKGISIQGVSGSVWQANIVEITHQNITLSSIKSRLSFWSLLKFDPTINLNFGDPLISGPEGQLQVSGLLDGITISNAKILVSANTIAQQLPLMIPLTAGGNASLTLDELILTPRNCQKATGLIQWPNASITALDEHLFLGDFSANISCDDGIIAVTVAPKNDLGLTFSTYLSATGVSGNGHLLPGNKFPDKLKSALPFLGKPDSKGQYRLDF